MNDEEIEIRINPKIINEQLKTPINKKGFKTYYNSSSLYKKYSLSSAKNYNHFRTLSSVSELKKDISDLNNKYKKNLKIRLRNENEIFLLQNKLRMLSMKENTNYNRINNEKNNKKKKMKIKAEKIINQLILKKNKEMKIEEIKKKKEEIKNLRIKDKKNSLIKKRKFDNNKELNYREFFTERRKNEKSIKKEKEKEIKEKRENYLKIKKIFEENKKRIILKEILKKVEKKKLLEFKVNEQEQYNNNLIKQIEKYQLQGLKTIERINTFVLS